MEQTATVWCFVKREYFFGVTWYFCKANFQSIPFAIKMIRNHDCFDCHREWNSERAVEMCRDFVFVRFHLLAFHFNEFRTCWTQPSSISRQTVEGSLGFAKTIKTSKCTFQIFFFGGGWQGRRTSHLPPFLPPPLIFKTKLKIFVTLPS